MSNETNVRLSRAIRIALGTGLAASMALAPAVQAADDTADLERVQVTGSRISRLDLEGAVPVTVIDREQIDLSGQISVADLLRSTSFNSAGSFRPQSGSSAQSFAGMSLRGLGEGRTLILVDGRRAPVAPNVGNAQDLNSIPLAAVERIEILSDGASAIYGSDAIGGVVNIITRKDFTGAEVTVGASNPSRAGGDTAEFSALMGVAGDRGQLMFGVSRNHRDIVFQADREWSRGGGSIFSNNFHHSGTAGDFYRNGVHGAVVQDDGCTAEGFGSIVVPQSTDPDAPVLTDEERQLCLYDFTLQAADEAELENQSLFVRGTYEMNSNWANYFNASVNRVQSFGRYAPVPSSPWPGGLPFLPAGSPNHPATAPGNGGLNPNWADYQDPAGAVLCPTPEGGSAGDASEFDGPDGITYNCNADDLMFYRYDPNGTGGGLTPHFSSGDLYFSHRFAALGPRDTSTDAHVYDANYGFEGRLGNFDLDFGLRHTESKYIALERNYVVGGLAQAAIDSGDYNIYDPFAVSDDVANSMIATINRESIFKAHELYAIANTDLFDMPAGMSQVAFGGEYREETYVDNYDSLSEAGQIVGSAGNSAGGGRYVAAFFFESLFPLTEDLEMNFAGRYDQYSDYGNDFSPKLSVRWQPIREMTLRASYGQGFRAPTLDILTQQPSFGAASVVHGPTAANFGVAPTESVQITTYSIANPNLESEQSDQFSLGVAFEPTNWFSGSVDYYNIEITNQITDFDGQDIVDCMTGASSNCPNGLSFLDPAGSPPNVAAGLGMAFAGNNPANPIQYGQTGFGNLGTLETDGLDINLRTTLDLGPGQLSNDLQLTYVASYEENGDDVAGESERPEIRTKLSNSYAFSDFSVAWNINFIGAQDTSEAGPPEDAAGNVIGPDPGVDSWLTHDLQANWFTPWNGRFTAGILNITDEDPPLDEGQLRGFNFNLYDGYGRLPYLRYTQSF